MNPVVSIMAQGGMGAATAAVLVANGVEVRTVVAGRSLASAERAKQAGMKPVTDEELVEVDYLLSIVPPAEAIPLAKRLAPLLTKGRKKPVYIDLNAVNPDTAMMVAMTIEPTGAAFVDGGIIGGPPKPGSTGTSIYVSGPDAPRAAKLVEHGLEMKLLGPGIGEASALKMSYAGITKGFTALGAAMMLAATRGGSAAALHAELAESQKPLFTWLTRQVPNMYSKAYRWVAEMEEISDFAGEDPAAGALFKAAAQFYERIAADLDGDGHETAALTAFCRKT